MTKTRRRSSLYYVRTILQQVWSHPANRHRRGRALARTMGWQLHKRAIRKPVELTLPSGIKVRCHPDSASASNLFYFGQYYEYDEMLFLEHYLRPGDGFIDGGANIGTYALMAGKIVGPRGRVDAFEPSPRAAGWFRENLALNGFEWVQLHKDALAERAGNVAFLSEWDVSNRILVRPDQSWMDMNMNVSTIQVSSVSLDEALPVDARYALAKLDLEGAEVVALRGAERHLGEANPPVWQVEVFEHLLRKMDSTPEELATIFADRGYSLCSYDGEANSVAFDVDLHSEVKGGRTNFLAVSNASRTEVLGRLASAGTSR